jgi:hypothetical protein
MCWTNVYIFMIIMEHIETSKVKLNVYVQICTFVSIRQIIDSRICIVLERYYWLRHVPPLFRMQQPGFD